MPADHAYVRHLAPPTGPDGTVHRLPDPDPDHPEVDGLVAGERWWPPVMLRPDWLARADYDLLHLHFGYDDQSPDQLRELTRALAERRRPLVLTVHDLRNPHQHDPTVATAQLDVLVPAASALITLTEAAAEQVAARWGRRPQVVPHPHVVDLATMRRMRQRRRRLQAGGRTFRVGVACKDLRTNTDPLRVLPTLLRTVRDLPGATLEVTVHRRTHDHPRDTTGRALVAWLAEVADDPVVDTVVHDRFPDAALWSRLAAIDVAVLPYLFGTHSGWLEACHDVGTAVVAPSVGCYADQGADQVYLADEAAVDTASLARAVSTAYADWSQGPERPLPGLDAGARRSQREEIAAAHLEVYRSVLLGAAVA